ncbi:MAG: MoaD/ThiS family protein [Bryobacteraceae bacterium]
MAQVSLGIFGITTARHVDGKIVRQVLDQLAAQDPELRIQLFNAEGTVRSFITVYLNDDDVRYLPEKYNTSVGPDDRISIVPSIAGGGPSDPPTSVTQGACRFG